jgi:hypothetical protein
VRTRNSIIAIESVKVAISSSSWFTMPERSATIGWAATRNAASRRGASVRNTCAASSHAA